MADISLLNAIRAGVMDISQPANEITMRSRAALGQGFGDALAKSGQSFADAMNKRAQRGLDQADYKQALKDKTDLEAQANARKAEAQKQAEYNKAQNDALMLEGEVESLSPGITMSDRFLNHPTNTTADWLKYGGALRGERDKARKAQGLGGSDVDLWEWMKGTGDANK